MTTAREVMQRARVQRRFFEVWRRPAAETEDYPGLVVHDDRVTGSITVGRTRLPVWALIWQAVEQGWDHAMDSYDADTYPFKADDMGKFLYCLMEARGEFGRLVLTLADLERGSRDAWWDSKRKRARMRAQLQRCLDALDACEPPPQSVFVP